MDKVSKRVEQFRSELVLHSSFISAADRVINAIYGEKERPIIAVSGPPGIGKTAMIRHFLSSIIAEETPRMQEDREYIPVVGVRVPAPETRAFPWRDTYHSMIEGLFDPASRSGVNFRTYKTKAHQRDFGFEFPTEKYLGRGTKQSLYRHFLRILEHRRPKAIVLDEAHHFVFGVRNVDNQMELLANRLKSMADEMGDTKLVLVGTYQMHRCLEATCQGTRRLNHIEFARYQYPDLHDASDPFLIALCSFDDILRDKLSFCLLDHAEDIYGGCLGCIGILKAWLEIALQSAGENKITVETLRASQMKERHLAKAMQEIMDGEAYIASLDQTSPSLWQQFAPKAQTKEVLGQTAKSKPSKRPFQANPRAFKKGFNHAK